MQTRNEILGQLNVREINADLPIRYLRTHEQKAEKLRITLERKQFLENQLRGMIVVSRIEYQERPSPRHWQKIGKIREEIRGLQKRLRETKKEVKDLLTQMADLKRG